MWIGGASSAARMWVVFKTAIQGAHRQEGTWEVNSFILSWVGSLFLIAHFIDGPAGW